jgi:hypothetical protein
MKKIISIFLSFSIVFLSVSTCIPISVCADTDKTVLSKSSDSPFAYSSSEAQKYVSAHLDIYDSDNTLLFSYTPTSTYNWTYSAKGKDNLHLSDNQLKAFLMSKKTLSAYAQLMFSGFSNNNVTRGFLSALGIATTGNSNALTDVSDKLLGNYNYIDSINYDEDTQTITMDNTSVDKLREEIKKYYYESIGVKFIKPVGTVKKYVDSSDFRKLFEYEDDYTSAYSACDASHAFVSGSNFAYFSKSNKNNMTGYYYMGNSDDDKRNSFTDWTTSVYTYRLYSYDSSGHSQAWEINNESYSVFYNYEWDNSDKYTPNPACLIPMWICPYYGQFVFSKDMRFDSATSESWRYCDVRINYYSADNIPFKYFSSYSAMYNFINGDQNAYLSSTIEKTGEDITFSIKDMNENLGNKMDALIDSINSNKGNMSADELQNAIDKGLEDLNKNTEDIKDNTEEMNSKLDSILEALNTQNETLLEILGVTKKISDTIDNIDDTANFNTVISLCGTVFLAIQSAILYGQNTLKDDNNETAPQSLTSNNDDVILYASGSGTSLDYRGGIFGHFPFSVIYHLYDWLKVLQTQPKCPEFSYNYGFLIGKKDDEKCVITFDLSQYEDWRKTISSFIKLSFTLAVAVGTYKKFKGGDVT